MSLGFYLPPLRRKRRRSSARTSVRAAAEAVTHPLHPSTPQKKNKSQSSIRKEHKACHFPNACKKLLKLKYSSPPDFGLLPWVCFLICKMGIEVVPPRVTGRMAEMIPRHLNCTWYILGPQLTVAINLMIIVNIFCLGRYSK